MRTLITLAVLALSSSALAFPPGRHYFSGGVHPPYPSHTNVSYYYIGGWPVSDSCLKHDSDGTIEASVCTPLKYASVGIWEVPHNNCTLTVYEGSKTCGRNATKEVHKIPRGNSVICASTGAALQDVSVVWACR